MSLSGKYHKDIFQRKKCTHKEDYTRKHMKGKNEVITYINKIFTSKHGQRLTYVFLYINGLQNTNTLHILQLSPREEEKVGIYGERQQVS